MWGRGLGRFEEAERNKMSAVFEENETLTGSAYFQNIIILLVATSRKAAIVAYIVWGSSSYLVIVGQIMDSADSSFCEKAMSDAEKNPASLIAKRDFCWL
jgi:hypothetical protein